MAKRAVLNALSDVDIRLIRIFITVSECGGFAASELELNIGRSTISRHISDLEHRVGLVLCNRGPSGFSLTPEGEQVLTASKRLLSSIEGFQSEVDEIHTHLTGTLRIGLFDQSSTNPNAKIDEAIRRFDKAAPEVSLEIAFGPPSPLETRVLDGTLDLAIVPMHRQSSSLDYLLLYEEQMSLYCGKDHSLFFAEPNAPLDQLKLARFKYAGYAFNSPNMKAGQTLGLRRAARVQEEEALVLLVKSGRYLGYLAHHVAAPFEAQHIIKAVAPKLTGYSTTFAAISRTKPKPQRKTLEFLKCLRVAHQI